MGLLLKGGICSQKIELFPLRAVPNGKKNSLVPHFEISLEYVQFHYTHRLGPVAHSTMCLATDACLTADPGVVISIPAPSYTFVEIDHEMISMVILLPSPESFKKVCCQLQAKVCERITN